MYGAALKAGRKAEDAYFAYMDELHPETVADRKTFLARARKDLEKQKDAVLKVTAMMARQVGELRDLLPSVEVVQHQVQIPAAPPKEQRLPKKRR